MARYVLEVMYDGTQFHGSQIQGGQTTVQLAINRTLSTILRKPIETLGASRTEEGVHALCNYYHFDLEQPLTFDLVYKCNAILGSGIAVKSIAAVSDTFNARFDAISRQYRYKIFHRKNPFLHHRAYFYPFVKDQGILNETAKIIAENQHFESFSKRNSQSKTFLCTIYDSHWEDHGEELHYVVRGNRFLRGMVRGLVGTQLTTARGKITVNGFKNIFTSNDCRNAFFDVPGFGLYLEHIEYPAGVLKPLEFSKT